MPALPALSLNCHSDGVFRSIPRLARRNLRYLSAPGFGCGTVTADGQRPDHCGQTKSPPKAQQERPQRGTALGKRPHGLNRRRHRLERISGRIHDGNNSTGGTPELANTKAMDGTPSQMNRVLLFERTAIAITAVEKTTTTSTGTSRNGITASQPPSNRSPSPTPTAVISAVPDQRARSLGEQPAGQGAGPVHGQHPQSG